MREPVPEGMEFSAGCEASELRLVDAELQCQGAITTLNMKQRIFLSRPQLYFVNLFY